MDRKREQTNETKTEKRRNTENTFLRRWVVFPSVTTVWCLYIFQRLPVRRLCFRVCKISFILSFFKPWFYRHYHEVIKSPLLPLPGAWSVNRGGSRTAATSKMECFIIKRFILDVAAALHPPLGKWLDHFTVSGKTSKIWKKKFQEEVLEVNCNKKFRQFAPK